MGFVRVRKQDGAGKQTAAELEREALAAAVRDGLEAYAERIRQGRVELAERIAERG